ncbi:MAG: PAS domain S-box protein [Caldilineaceae bacterium]|nr:PAS domain S-box protein [Caldilineaceae bacterium]
MSHQPSTASSDWDVQVSLKLLGESMPIAVVIVDSHGQIVYVNARLEEMFGYEQGELIGKLVEVLIPERFHHSHFGYRHDYMHSQHVRNMGSGMDLAGRRKDGSEFPLEAGLSPLRYGDAPHIVVTITDISKRKQVEMMLARQVEERTHELERRQRVLEGLRAILTTLISNHPLPEILGFISNKAVQLLQADGCVIYSRDERLGLLQPQASSGMTTGDAGQLLSEFLTEQAPIYNEPLVLAPGLPPIPAFSYSLPATLASPIGQGQSGYLTVPIRDTQQIYGLFLFHYEQRQEISHQDIELALRVADQTVLAIANAHLRGQIEHSAVTAERSRIARDLHDAVTQTLFSASIIAGVLPVIWQRNEEEGRKRLEELRELTRGALAEMRTLLLELRPAKLVEVDLADLLRQLAEAISGRARVPVTVDVEGTAEVSADVKIALYRVAQEALNNIAKHAQARNAWIKLHRTEDRVTLSVRDDGSGFVFEHIAPQHLGLSIMRERADGIGATLSVDARPGEGTTVEVDWHKMNSTLKSSAYDQ